VELTSNGKRFTCGLKKHRTYSAPHLAGETSRVFEKRPERDTGSIPAEYASFFHPKKSCFTGLGLAEPF
jgi:hypothetical protein